MNGPTLNTEYNGLLVYWNRQGYGGEPKCEDCEADLTGCEVVETRWSWLCVSCAEDDTTGVGPDESRAERRQLGLTG